MDVVIKSLVLFTCILISGLTLHAQDVVKNPNAILDTYVDERDQHEYEIIQIDSLWWFNQNLNYKTEDSDCFANKEENCFTKGRLYSFNESKNACPSNWRLPNKEEFDNLTNTLFQKENGDIVYLDKTWEDLNTPHESGFQFQQSGFKHKKRYTSELSMNIWLDDVIDGYHVHMYLTKKSKRMVLFRHEHEANNSIIKKRKFAIRCVRHSSR